MAVTHKRLRSAAQAVAVLYVGVSLLLGKASVLVDDLRYGRPRTT